MFTSSVDFILDTQHSWNVTLIGLPVFPNVSHITDLSSLSSQFFQRTQMQTVRSTIPSNNPPIRPTSQTHTAAVYNPNQPFMMTMAPMAFPSPQAAQYYIPQVRRHKTTDRNHITLAISGLCDVLMC